MKNHYNILSVDCNATDEEIKKAYRFLALKWHPDRNHEKDAVNKFIEINESYQILIDFEKRKVYDELLEISRKKDDDFLRKEPTYQRYEKWQENASREAESMAKSSFESFQENLTNTIKVVGQTAQLGCAFIFGLALSGCALFSLGLTLYRIVTWQDDVGIGWIIFGLIYGIGGTFIGGLLVYSPFAKH